MKKNNRMNRCGIIVLKTVLVIVCQLLNFINFKNSKNESLSLSYSTMKSISFTTAILFLAFFSFSQDRITGLNFATRSEVIAHWIY